MKCDRVVCFIDGLNLFHAISRLRLPHLNWVDPQALSRFYIKSKDEEVTRILYFSALATHMDESSQKRQQSYITALQMRNIKPILGQFKQKDRYCPKCFSHSRAHEEKETDVNIALALLDLAYQNVYDRALLISNDSDLWHRTVPTIQHPHQTNIPPLGIPPHNNRYGKDASCCNPKLGSLWKN